MKKRITTFLAALIIFICTLPSAVFAAGAPYAIVKAKTDGTFTSGDYRYSTYASAYEDFVATTEQDNVILGTNGKVYAMKQGMVITRSSSSTLVYSSTYPGGSSAYVSNNSVCYYISSDSSAKARFRLSSFEGTAAIGNVLLIPSAHIYPRKTSGNTDQFEFDYYTRSSAGNMIHYLSTYSSSKNNTNFAAIGVDAAPEFMVKGVRYYSTDSFHYFTDPYDAIKNDITASSYAGYHCIYYKYLSYRSKTSYSASQLNSYIAYRNSTISTSIKSAYLGLGSAFISAQNKYGINAAMEIAFANLESYYGKSGYATDRNNIFGINAVDSDPDKAYYFTSTAECVRQHAYYTLSRGYFDALTDSRYFGAFCGGKGGGVNVKYASDPWHGEKISYHTYVLDKYLGSEDYGKYTIGLTKGAAKAYAKASTSSAVLYKYTEGMSSKGLDGGMAVIVLEKSGDFYKVQSDMPITSSGKADYTSDYNYERSVVYIPVSSVELIYISADFDKPAEEEPSEGENVPENNYRVFSEGQSIEKYILSIKEGGGNAVVMNASTPLTTGAFASGMVIQLYDSEGKFLKNESVSVIGDTDGDGSVTTTDLVILRRYLAGLAALKGEYINAADLNTDKSIDTTDLVLMRRYLAGLINKL